VKVGLALLALVAGLTSCNGLLDLDPAHVDPALGARDTGAGASGSGGDASQAPSLCEQYCSAITEGCTGERTQYTDRDACLAACPLFPQGNPGDTSGNSIQCRLGYALKAPSEPITYCTFAGPGGDGMCGSNCEGFCTLMTAACTPTSTTAAGDYFESGDDCLATCANVPAIGNYCATDESITGGRDIFECRLYHVAAGIYADDPALHCPHATGKHLCVDD
jgi:hypothetical protein